MVNIRQAAVAGTFYPSNSEQLNLMVKHYLNEVPQGIKTLKAIIVPHAGFIYSGSIAATAYARLEPVKQIIKQVVLVGPSHRVSFQGLALSTADQFMTLLGQVSINKKAVQQLAEIHFVNYLDHAHELEHSLEVHLPFLQTVLQEFSLIPIVVGDATADQVCQVIELFWGQKDTLIVISSDLSHFYDYKTAMKLDQKTSEIIEQLQCEKLKKDAACGQVAIVGLMALARVKGLQIKTIDLRNSGDTAGSENMDRVVGYGAYVVE